MLCGHCFRKIDACGGLFLYCWHSVSKKSAPAAGCFCLDHVFFQKVGACGGLFFCLDDVRFWGEIGDFGGLLFIAWSLLLEMIGACGGLFSSVWTLMRATDALPQPQCPQPPSLIRKCGHKEIFCAANSPTPPLGGPLWEEQKKSFGCPHVPLGTGRSQRIH